MSQLHTEPEAVYHAQAGKYLSSHLLGTFSQCPALYHLMATKKYTRPDKDYYIIGRALHCLVLEGLEEYKARYIANSPINLKTGKPYGSMTNVYGQWAEGQRAMGLEIITPSQQDLVLQMAITVNEHKEIARILQEAPLREKVMRTKYCEIECQIRMDALGEGVGIVDLKTCDRLNRLPYAARDYNYYGQLAFYRAVLGAADIVPWAKEMGLPIDVYLIAVEKQFPHRCGIWHVDKASLDEAQEDNEQLIKELKECQASNTWPTRYEDMRYLRT